MANSSKPRRPSPREAQRRNKQAATAAPEAGQALPLFQSVEEMLAVSGLEKAGVWRRYPNLPEAWFKIAHVSRSKQRQRELILAYRKEHEIVGEIDHAIADGIRRRAAFGTQVTAWAGASLAGLEFTEENLLRLTAAEELDDWLFAQGFLRESFVEAHRSKLGEVSPPGFAGS